MLVFLGIFKEKHNNIGYDIKENNSNKQIVGNIEIPYTSKSEQELVGKFFTHFDNLITLHQRKLEEEKKKKKALQQLLLTGIVRTN